MKKYTQIAVAIFISISIPIISYAKTSLYLESNPFAFALNGYSLHAGIEEGHS